ncbi:MAG: hypothetical protein AABX47_05115 [Nanoarchaeota archaeon]
MKDELKTQLIEYWLDNPSEISNIPDSLKSKISREELSSLLLEIEPSKDSIGGTNSVRASDLFKHLELVRKKQKEELEIHSIRLHDETLLRQTQIQEDMKRLQGRMNRWQSLLFWATAFLALATLIMAAGVFWQAREARRLADISIAQISPNVNLEILSSKMPWVFSSNESHRADYISLQKSEAIKRDGTLSNEFAFPVNISIFNLGNTPVRLETISQSFACGDGFSREIPLNPSEDRVIRPSESWNTNQMVFVEYISKPQNQTYCRVGFKFEFGSFIKDKTIELRLS